MQKMLLADSQNGEWKEKDEDEYRNREDGVNREMRTPKKSSMERTKAGRRASQPTVPFDSFVHTLDD